MDSETRTDQLKERAKKKRQGCRGAWSAEPEDRQKLGATTTQAQLILTQETTTKSTAHRLSLSLSLFFFFFFFFFFFCFYFFL